MRGSCDAGLRVRGSWWGLLAVRIGQSVTHAIREGNTPCNVISQPAVVADARRGAAQPGARADATNAATTGSGSSRRHASSSRAGSRSVTGTVDLRVRGSSP